MSDYSDPYNFNYATPIKPTKINSEPATNEPRKIPNKGFNVFNPNRPKQPVTNAIPNINTNTNTFTNVSLNNPQNDELQGTIDMNKNVYDKSNNYNYDDGEELPLLEGILVYLCYLKLFSKEENMKFYLNKYIISLDKF